MNKKNTLILLIVTGLIGSIVTFYTTNFIMADVGNYTYGYNGYNYLASIPGFVFALEFIAFTMLIIRVYIRPQYKKRTILHYIRILVFFSLIGFVGALLAGVFAYHSFVKPYPFPCYLILSILIHGAIIVCGIYSYSSIKRKVEDDPERKKMTIGYVLYSFILPLVIFFAYNRFGALLLSPLYAQGLTLYMTWPLYLWLSAPMLILLYIVFKAFNVYKNINDQICYLVLYVLFAVVIGVSCIITGKNNPLFVAVISPAFGLDRLGTYPYVFIIHFAQTVIFGLYFLLRDLYIKFIKKEG